MCMHMHPLRTCPGQHPTRAPASAALRQSTTATTTSQAGGNAPAAAAATPTTARCSPPASERAMLNGSSWAAARQVHSSCEEASHWLCALWFEGGANAASMAATVAPSCHTSALWAAASSNRRQHQSNSIQLRLVLVKRVLTKCIPLNSGPPAPSPRPLSSHTCRAVAVQAGRLCM